jgi:hypothetical protein
MDKFVEIVKNTNTLDIALAMSQQKCDEFGECGECPIVGHRVNVKC